MLLELTILAALFFSFWNGFTDAANSIATVIGTRVLTPVQAVALAALGNFTGLLFGAAVATTIGKDLLVPEVVTVQLVLAVIAGGMLWEIITWWWGLPISESHVLVGGLVGAAIASVGTQAVIWNTLSGKILLPLVFAPVLAGVFAFFFTGFTVRVMRNVSRHTSNWVFKKLQVVSAFSLSVTHGANDAQKTAGIITALLLARGVIPTFDIPEWVFAASFLAISLGTFFGGWRIVKTMSHKVTRLRPYQGFCAETGGALILAITARMGFPVSTTHAITGGIMGVGAAQRTSAVRWGVARNIMWAWLLTMPASALFAWLAFKGFDFLF
ncbi:MAG: inorganic phosphate transporter [Candidatus Micrarchaeia archaeon]